MGSIGLPELVVVSLIFLVLVVVVVWLIKRSASSTPAVPPGLVPCKACGHGMSPRAAACPRCGDPMGTGA